MFDIVPYYLNIIKNYTLFMKVRPDEQNEEEEHREQEEWEEEEQDQ